MTAKEIKDLFNKYNLTLSSVESFTGGLFASEITSISGASTFYKGGLVTYYTEEKIRLLGIDKKLIGDRGVVSYECASEMAIKGREVTDSDITVSFTGNAGPSAMEEKPVGEIYIGLASKVKAEVYKYMLTGSRDEIRRKAIEISYELLEKFIIKN